jgi:hypothetical protein
MLSPSRSGVSTKLPSQGRSGGPVTERFSGLIRFVFDRVADDSVEQDITVGRPVSGFVPQCANLGPTYDWAGDGADYCA